jgi:hypothetical protein
MFIQHLQDQDRMNPPGCTTEELMNLAEGKVNQMKVLEEHKATDTGKQQELLALKAEVNTLKEAVNTFKKSKVGDKSSDSTAGGNNGGGGSNQRRKGKGKQNDPNKKPFPVELKGAPKPDDPSKPRIIDGVKYWWCKIRKKWGKHSPDQCTLKDNNNNKKKNSSESDRNGALVEANMAIMEAGR